MICTSSRDTEGACFIDQSFDDDDDGINRLWMDDHVTLSDASVVVMYDHTCHDMVSLISV